MTTRRACAPPSPGTSTTAGVLANRFTESVKSSASAGNARAHDGWAVHASNNAVSPSAAFGQNCSIRLTCGGATESTTRLRIPSG